MTTNAAQAATRPDRDRLYALASAQDGYFTTAQAAEAGDSTHLLFHHMSAGTVLRARRGIYRLVHFPAGEREDLTVLWLWSGHEGVYSHETALSLHGLSDALPEVRHMVVPVAWRSRRLRVPGELLVGFGDVEARDRAWVGAVPVTAPARTIADCVRAHVSSDLIRQALREGLERGLFRWPVVAAEAHAVALRRPRGAP